MKTLVYGLGGYFKYNEEFIRSHYGNLTFCDRNAKLLEQYRPSISREKIGEVIEEYDKVLVVAEVADIPAIITELLSFGIPFNKCEILYYTLRIKDKPNSDFFFGMTFLGQFSDDAVLMGICQKIGLKLSEMTYLEIGTNDPVIGNNTYNFYRCGARGVLVDPLEASMLLSGLARPEDRFVRGVVSGNAETVGSMVKLYVCTASQGSSIERRNVGQIRETIEVRDYDVNELMAMFPHTPDMVIIDTEGQDDLILFQLDYERYKPIIIEAEVNKINFEKLVDYMSEKGYKLTVRLGSNAIFILVDKAQLLGEWN